MSAALSLRRVLPLALVMLPGLARRAEAQLTSGDRLFVGQMTTTTFAALQTLPLPKYLNQKFCDTIQLLGGQLREAYVPTAAERGGNFSAFAALLTDPSTEFGGLFPGGIIPLNRIPDVFAWRIADPPGGAGPDCLPYSGPIPFTSRFYESGFIPGDRQLAAGATTLTFDYTQGASFADTQSVPLYSTGATVPFIASASLDASSRNGWLSIRPASGGTPALLQVTVNPSGLAPGVYFGSVSLLQSSGQVLLALDAAPAPPRQDTAAPIQITLIVRAPPTFLLISKREVRLDYDLTTPQAPFPTADVGITSNTGASLRFTVKPVTKTPAGFDWLSATISVGVAPTTITLTANPTGLGAGSYLAIVRFSATAGCAVATAARMAASTAPAPANCDADRLLAVILRIIDRSRGILSATPDTLAFPVDGRTADTVQIVTGGADAQNFVVTPVAIEPACATWLSTRSPFADSGAAAQLIVDVSRAGLTQSGDLLGYVGVSSTVGSVTAGTVVTVTLGGPPGMGGAPPSPAPSGVEQAILAADSTSPPLADSSASQIIADVVDGATWKTSITLINSDLTSAKSFTLRFWPGAATPPGQPLFMDGADQLSGLALTRTIPPGGSLILRTLGSSGGSVWQGWAELISSPAVGGTAILSRQLSADVDAEGAMSIKPSTIGRLLLPFDNSRPYSTVLALVNPNATAATTVIALFRDQLGTTLAEPTTFTLGPRGQDTYALQDRFPNLAGKRGVAEFSSACGELAGLGLRQHDPKQGFTTLETIDPDSAGGVTAIPNIIAGSGWETTTVLVNTSSRNPANFTLRFWPGKDTPSDQSPSVEGHPRRELALNGSIPAGGSLNVEVRGAGSGLLWQGWAELSATSSDIAAVAVYRRQIANDDFAEAAAWLSPLRSLRFLLPFDNSSSSSTTLVVANPNAQQPNVRISFRSESGQPVATPGPIPLQTRGYDTFSLAARFREVDSLRGVAELTSTGPPIAGVGLLSSPRFGFASVPLLRK